MKIKFTLYPNVLLAACFLLISSSVFSQQTLRTNLFVVSADGNKTLMDGNMTIYDDIYCNCVNYEDAIKLTNPGENWGLLRSSITLSVERRKFIPERDTTYIRMLNMQQRNFTIQVIGRNLEKIGRIGYVKDNHTNTTTPILLNDTTYINFSVNSNSSTSASNRFSVIFEKPSPPPPLDFTGIQLLRKGNLVNVAFTVAYENLVNNYVLQQAGDAFNFKDVKTVTAHNRGGNESYNQDAGTCAEGDNFYRVKAVSTDGKITYSPIAKLSSLVMNIYPNPIASRQLNLQIAVAKEGRYEVKAIGMNGVIRLLGFRQLTSMQSLQQITLPYNISPGVYQIQLTGPGNEVIVKSVTIL